MNESANSLQPKVLRLIVASVGLGLLSLLLVARALEPSPSGFGTHRQLGLPPCHFQLQLRLPCPSCGMTTSWAYLTRGDLVSAARANIGGVMMALGVAIVGAWMLASGIAGRWVVLRPSPWWVLSGAAVIYAVILVRWLVLLLA